MLNVQISHWYSYIACMDGFFPDITALLEERQPLMQKLFSKVNLNVYINHIVLIPRGTLHF